MCVLNQRSKTSRILHLSLPQATQLREPVWMSQPMASGEVRERVYLDVRVFNPFARSNARHSIPEMYKTQEREKRQYEQRIREVEHGSFTPLVMSCTGGYTKESTVFFKHLANLLAAINRTRPPPPLTGSNRVEPHLFSAVLFNTMPTWSPIIMWPTCEGSTNP